METPLVSIYVPVYNHENYIVRALDSILMQQTAYSYEVLVGEDCSTDHTRQILQAWEKSHPDPRFTFFYRQQNMHHTETPNGLDLKLRCKGKYLICLEGDDFWTDPKKLEKQVTFLESHPEYYAVAHNCTVVDADSVPNGETYPECKEEEYTFRHYANNILPGQLTTMLSRNYMTDALAEQNLLRRRLGPGDRNIYFAVLLRGRIRCMQESMSAYRHITTGGSSFSATVHYRYDAEEQAARYRLEVAYAAGNSEAIRCTEHLYLRNLRKALLHRYIGLRQFWKDFGNIRHKCAALWRLLRRDIRRKFLHKPLAF